MALPSAMRPHHWVKNLFVLAPIFFAGRFDSPLAWGHCGLAVASFCLLSSAVYLINDICDREEDRWHPDKRGRPIPSGRLSVGLATGSAVVLMVVGLGLAGTSVVWADWSVETLAGWGLLLWAGTYLVLNLLYSLWIKHHMYVDVIFIAMGFVLRAMGGAAAIGVGISPWLVVCTFTLCLFLGFTKRRGEMTQLADKTVEKTRRTNQSYQLRELDRLITISAGLAIMTYALYCLAPRTVQHIGSAHMVWTIPLVVYGIFRYDRLSRLRGRGDVVQLLMGDTVLWMVIGVYLAVAMVVVKFGDHPAVAPILDVQSR
ncbi:MAG: UbiA prenyltransferase family protein [Phycisphaerae bacterium]